MDNGTKRFFIVFAVLIILALALLLVTTLINSNSDELKGERINVSTGFLEPRGSDKDNAGVVIIEFSDFQCSFCKRTQPALKQLVQEYGDNITIYYRHFPLTNIHENAYNAALAASCANEQGKFWEYHDVLFEKQHVLSKGSLKEYAAQVGLNFEQFSTCLDSEKYSEKIEQDFSDGIDAGVTGTPTFFINGIPIVGVQSFDNFKTLIENELKEG